MSDLLIEPVRSFENKFETPFKQNNDEKLQELERKLRVTQNITEMSEEQYQVLWNKAMKSYKAVGKSNKRRN